jgi:hypothetical protein
MSSGLVWILGFSPHQKDLGPDIRPNSLEKSNARSPTPRLLTKAMRHWRGIQGQHAEIRKSTLRASAPITMKRSIRKGRTTRAG